MKREDLQDNLFHEFFGDGFMTLNNIEVEEVYKWLNIFDDDVESYLRNPVKRLIAQVMEAIENKDYPGAIYYIDIAVDVSESMGNFLEQAEAHFRCGYAYYQMGNYIDAITEYRQAKNYYDTMHLHNQAITNWMLGYALWRIMKLSNAIVEWERSCNKFQILKDAAIEQKEDEQAEWYGEIRAIMCSDLGKAIENGRWPIEEISGNLNE